jgi:hypothetical protein
MSKNVEDQSPFEDDVHYFPQADDEAMRRFAVPFLKMMFVHANFEGVFRDLLNAVARDKTFSAKRKNRWTANERAEKMRQLMIEHGCEDAEIATAHRVLSDAFPLCNDRNLLAHGVVAVRSHVRGSHSDGGSRARGATRQLWLVPQFECFGTNSICPSARSTGVTRPNT